MEECYEFSKGKQVKKIIKTDGKIKINKRQHKKENTTEDYMLALP